MENMRDAARRGRQYPGIGLTLALAGLLAWAQSASAQTLEGVAATGMLKIGYREDALPFSFKTEVGEAAGYTIDLCRKIAADVKEELGLAEIDLEYIAVGTEDRFDAIANGEIDILCGATTATLSRREQVSFSLPTFLTGVSALLQADASSFLREVLAGRKPTGSPRTSVLRAFVDRKFGARSGTTTEAWLQKSLGALATSAEMVSVPDHEDGLRLLQEDEIDAYFADRAILVGLVAQSDSPDDFEIGERFFTYELYALALPRGDEEFRLVVDRTLSRLARTGDIDPIFSRHFGKPGEAVQTLFLINSLPE